MRLIALSLSSGCALALLAATTAAQSAGALSITRNTQFVIGDHAPHLSLDGDQFVARGVRQSDSPSSVMVFTRSAGTWSLQTQFTMPYGSAQTNREMDVALRGTRLVVGVSSAADGNGDIRISEFSGGSWGPFTIVPEPVDYNNFGNAVLQRENLVFAGFPATSIQIGMVCVFRYNGAGWHDVADFSQPSASGIYGTLLADSGDTLLVGTYHEADVRVRGATASSWIHQALLVPTGSGSVTALALDGNVALVGSYSVPLAPHIDVFERSGTSWSHTAALTGLDLGPSTWFGASLGVHGDTLYVGAPGADSGQGAVYVFQRVCGAWIQTAKITPGVPVSGGGFGRALAVDGTTLLVSAETSDPSQATAGTVYVFDIAALPLPQTYCTAKVNSHGCVPQIGSGCGIAGASSPNPFPITASNVLNQKTGLLLYSVAGPANTPFLGGTLCLAAPLRRTAARNSAGNVGPDDCSGFYDFDFNAHIQSGVDPALVPGVQVWAQFYSRDPADPFGVGLTDGLAFTIGS